jgi:hypothetical protein
MLLDDSQRLGQSAPPWRCSSLAARSGLMREMALNGDRCELAMWVFGQIVPLL